MTDPITSLLPTTDAQTLLIASLDSNIRLLDLSTGKVLNTFSSPGYVSKEYRVRACFGAGEATIVGGDEEGRVWGWDLVDVSFIFQTFSLVHLIMFELTKTFTGNSPSTKSAT